MLIKVFTDGACSGNPGSGGWSVIINKPEGLRVLEGGSEETTNNRMELVAVNEALHYIEKYGKAKEVYEINSDSAYVINSIVNKWVNAWSRNGWKTTAGESVKNRDLWDSTLTLISTIKKIKKIDLRFVKVKGHNGNSFNEKADEIARAQALKFKREAQQL